MGLIFRAAFASTGTGETPTSHAGRATTTCEPYRMRLMVEPVRKAYNMGKMHELFDGSEAQELDGGWVSFSVAQPEGLEIVQQYLGEAVLEHSNPPEWAFPTERWRGKKDSAATHWRYVDAPNAG